MAEFYQAGGQAEVSVRDALYEAALLALRAPSVANTQPWRWRLRHEVLDLYADWSRQMKATDPQGRMLVVSCGAALHHARVALTVLGYEPDVRRLPHPDQPDLLARVATGGTHEVTPEDHRRHHCIRIRHTDRRPFVARAPVPAEMLEQLRRAATAEGASVHVIGAEQLRYLAVAATAASEIEKHDQNALDEWLDWTQRDQPGGEGAPAAVIPRVTRPVPLRDFALGKVSHLTDVTGEDRFTDYLVLATDKDEPVDWLRAGEASSALMLAATDAGLALSIISNVIEVPGARALLRSLLPYTAHPQLVVRVGFNESTQPLPPSSRRSATDVIEVDENDDQGWPAAGWMTGRQSP